MTLTPNPGGQYVLVVDGDFHRGKALVSEMRASGCYAATATSGAEALRYVAENEPDAVVSEWELPDMTGLELVRRMTLEEASTKAILHREKADWHQLRQTLECGGEDLLSNPVHATELLRALTRHGK